LDFLAKNLRETCALLQRTKGILDIGALYWCWSLATSLGWPTATPASRLNASINTTQWSRTPL